MEYISGCWFFLSVVMICEPEFQSPDVLPADVTWSTNSDMFNIPIIEEMQISLWVFLLFECVRSADPIGAKDIDKTIDTMYGRRTHHEDLFLLFSFSFSVAMYYFSYLLCHQWKHEAGTYMNKQMYGIKSLKPTK